MTPHNKDLSGRLRALSAQVGQQRIRLDVLLTVFRGRAVYALLVLLALPFLLPIPLPLLSTPFGVLIALTGFQVAMRRRPVVPARWAHKELPAGFIPKVLSAASSVTGWLEKISKPRWVSPGQLRGFHRLTGTMIACAGLLLLLPLPIPLSNLLPASAVLLLATASLRRDGLCLVGGCTMLLISVGFLVTLGLAGAEFTEWLRK